MKKIYRVSGRMPEEIAKLSEDEKGRAAQSFALSWQSPNCLQVWSNRAAMAKSCRMQQSRAPRPDDWRPVVPLSPGEGY